MLVAWGDITMSPQYILAKLMKKLRGAAITNSHIPRNSKVEAGSVVINSTFERHSFCGYDCFLQDVKVGPFVSIGTRVTVGGASHPVHFVSTSPVFLSHRDSVRTKLARHDFLPRHTTCIGADVWVGDGAYIKAGTTIGVGAVIGMGAVVTHDVLPYSIVGGNPARVIRMRFSNEVCDELLASQWWKLGDSDLAQLGHLIPNPQIFAEAIREKFAK